MKFKNIMGILVTKEGGLDNVITKTNRLAGNGMGSSLCGDGKYAETHGFVKQRAFKGSLEGAPGRGIPLGEYNGRQWDAGQVTRSRIEPVLGLEVLPDNFYWTDANNEDVPVTKEELKSLYQAMLTAMVDRGFSIHRRQREMKQLVSLMTRVRDVDDFVVGW